MEGCVLAAPATDNSATVPMMRKHAQQTIRIDMALNHIIRQTRDGRKDYCIATTFHRLEAHFFRQAGGDNPACFLVKRRLIPARFRSVVAAHVERITARDGPDPRLRAIGFAVLTERRDMQVVRFGDFPQFLFRPFSYL
jgi:hypothetical protein